MDQVIGVMVVIISIGLLTDKDPVCARGTFPTPSLGNGVEIA
jgi:hypothetical protein